jgi:hypothetical protein
MRVVPAMTKKTDEAQSGLAVDPSPNCQPNWRDNCSDHNHAQQGGALNDGRYCSGLAFGFFVHAIGCAHVCERL